MANRDHNHTLRIAAEAIEKIKALSLPADPPGYELWYSYAAGGNPDLNRTINQKLDANGRLSMDELDQIHDKYFCSTRDQANLARFGTKVSTEIGNAIVMLDELILSTSKSRDDCADASTNLERTTDHNSVKAIADTLIKSLRDVELQYEALERRFAGSKRELDTLQKALAEMSIESGRDPLTGLANRRQFDQSLDEAMERTKADSAALSLLMIDIDDFKRFNDRFGHVTGDSVLRLVGSVLTQSIKGQNRAARYGGEEFAVILPNTELEGAIVVAESIRRKMMRRELRRRSTGEQLGAITVSIGVASHRMGERARALIERADACLYEAKRAGRNCTKCDDVSMQIVGDAA